MNVSGGRLRRIFKKGAVCLCALVLALITIPVFVVDSFIVEGDSMLPTLSDGKRVYVNKLLMGARIYTKYDFDSPELGCFRMPGLRGIEVGDIAVFNYPYARGNEIGFLINYVYVKRCLGCPGDTVSVTDGYYINSDADDTGIPVSCQMLLEGIPDSVFVRMPDEGLIGFPTWTMKDFGPYYVPARGDKVVLDSMNTVLYGRLVEYETGVFPERYGDEYVFRENYYFFAGDNVLHSKDSRYFGLVPEDFIIGVCL